MSAGLAGRIRRQTHPLTPPCATRRTVSSTRCGTGRRPRSAPAGRGWMPWSGELSAAIRPHCAMSAVAAGGWLQVTSAVPAALVQSGRAQRSTTCVELAGSRARRTGRCGAGRGGAPVAAVSRTAEPSAVIWPPDAGRAGGDHPAPASSERRPRRPPVRPRIRRPAVRCGRATSRTPAAGYRPRTGSSRSRRGYTRHRPRPGWPSRRLEEPARRRAAPARPRGDREPGPVRADRQPGQLPVQPPRQRDRPQRYRLPVPGDPQHARTGASRIAGGWRARTAGRWPPRPPRGTPCWSPAGGPPAGSGRWPC